MKKNEFPAILDSILNKLPHSNLLDAMKYLEKLVEEHLASDPSTFTPQINSYPPTPLPANLTLLEELNLLEFDKLAEHIRKSTAWKHKDNLKALATDLGLKFSTRWNKEQLLDSIVTHLRIQRMPTALHVYSRHEQG